MSRTRSPRASNITRSAISAFVFALAAACASKVTPPSAVIAAVPASHVGVAVQLDGSQSLSMRAGTPLTWAWAFTALPPRSRAALNDAHLAAPSFVPDVAGTFVVQLTVDDGLLASSTSATVNVADDCRPAIASLTQSPEKPNIGQTAAISANAAPTCGTGNAIVSYQWSIVSAPAGSKAQLLLAGTQHPSFTPDVRGDYDLLVQVTDALGLKSDPADPKAHLTYSTRPCGDNAPVVASIAAAPATPNVGSPVQLSATVTDADADASCGLQRSYTYAWSLVQLPTGSAARLNNAALTAPSFTPDVHGHYVVALTVTDNLGRASAQATRALDTSLCGDATPVATALVSPAAAGSTPTAAGASVASGTAVQLHTGVTDSDNAAYNGIDSTGGPATTGAGCGLALTYSYQWQLVSAPKGSRAQLNNVALANPSFVADIQGSYVLSVVAIASTGHASAPSFVTVTALPCGSVPPTAAIDQSGAVAATSQPFSLTATVADTNDSCSTPALVVAPLQYAWSIVSAPAGSKAQLSGTGAAGTSAAASPSFTPDLAGDYKLALTVTDQLGLKAIAAPTTITANPCNLPLSSVLSFASSGPSGVETGVGVSLSAAVTDPNAPSSAAWCTAAVQPYSYAWSIVAQPAGSAAALNNAAAASPSFTPDVVGTYTVRLVVTDAAGNKSPAVTQDIANVGSCTSPLAGSISFPAGALGTGSPIALGATVTDPNLKLNTPACPLTNGLLSYAWSLAAQPSGSHAALNNASAANPSFVADVSGDYLVQLVATDAIGLKTPALQQKVTVGTCTAALTGAVQSSAAPAVGLPVTLSVAGLVDPNAAAAGCTAATAPFSYAWQLVGQPAGSHAALNNAAASAPAFTPDATGAYAVQVTVTDAAGNKGVFTSTVAVGSTCTQPLSFTSATPATPTNAVVSLSSTSPSPVVVTVPWANVADANDLKTCTGASSAVAPVYSFQWALIARPPRSAASVIDPAGTTAGASNAAKFVADVAGTYVLLGKVTDQLGNSATAQVSVPVAGCSTSGPAVTAKASTASAEVGQQVGLTALVNDPSPTNCGSPATAPFSYAWTLAGPAASNAVIPSPRNAQASFAPDVASASGWTATVLVTDALGLQGSASTGAVTSFGCAMTPVVSSAAGTSFNAGSQVQLSAAPGFAAGCTTPPPVSYAWSFDQLPAGSNASFNNAAVQAPSFTVDVAGAPTAWIARVTITDLVTGATGTSTIGISATACGKNAPVAGVQVPGFVTTTDTATTVPTTRNNAGTINAGTAVQLDGTYSTTPNAACSTGLAYTWGIYQLPPGSVASVSPQGAARPTVTLDKNGDYIFTLAVNDGLKSSPATYLFLHVGP